MQATITTRELRFAFERMMNQIDFHDIPLSFTNVDHYWHVPEDSMFQVPEPSTHHVGSLWDDVAELKRFAADDTAHAALVNLDRLAAVLIAASYLLNPAKEPE